MTRILILGGYGVFGGRAAERLARDPGLAGEARLEIIIAGRNLAAAEAKARALAGPGKTRLEAAALDATALTAGDLRGLGATIVLNTAGPYQARDYRVPMAAIEAGAHYIDLADARGFVTGIGALDAAARAASVLVVSGASSVPALAAAVIDTLMGSFATLDAVTYGISPGNSFDPGEATTASILGAAGRPFTTLVDRRMTTVHGWQPLTRHRFADAEIGSRLLGACDVPDLDLFPARYPTLRTQRFLAGVEVKAFHAGIWALSWLVRAGLLARPERLGRPMLAVKRRLGFLGSDRGAMFVTLEGTDAAGSARRVTWTLVARQGHGPFIPATPAVILAKRLAGRDPTLRGAPPLRGAMPCVGLFTLDEFTAEVADLDIRQTIT